MSVSSSPLHGWLWHLVLCITFAMPSQEEWRGEVEQVSWSPRAFLYKKLLSEEECDHLINHVRRLASSACTALARMRRQVRRHTSRRKQEPLSARAGRSQMSDSMCSCVPPCKPAATRELGRRCARAAIAAGGSHEQSTC